jgi:hypothetical protein
LPVVLYGCGTWSVILMEEQHILRIFGDRMLSIILEKGRIK